MYISIAIIIFMLIALISEKIDPLKILIFTISIFLLMGSITIEEISQNLINKGVLSIISLYVIAGAIEKSSIFRALTRFDAIEEKKFRPYKLFGLVGALSSFLNNIPIVSIFIPTTNKIANKIKIPASKLLIPISYISMLGGTLTLIGSSTNLIASGVIESYGLEGFRFFELSMIAISSVVLGFIYISIFHVKWLPDTSKNISTSKKAINSHVIRFTINKNSAIIGKNIYDAGLRNLENMYLSEVERNGVLLKLNATVLLKENDILIFTGQTNMIDDLRSIKGLRLEIDDHLGTNYFDNEQTTLLEVVITQNISNSNQSVKQLKFRDRYQAIIMGVIREGKNITKKIGDVSIKLGDTLLLIVDRDYVESLRSSYNFTIINQESRVAIKHNVKSVIPFFIIVAVILTSVIFNIHILDVSVFGIALLIVTNTINPSDALRSINFKTIALLVLSISLGTVIVNVGITEYISTGLSSVLINLNPLFLMAVIFVLIAIFTLVLSNNSVIAIVLPIVIALISATDYDVRPFLIVATIAASATYLSPYSYQTNIMVYGAGGYKFIDFIKFGFPLLLIVMASTIISAYLLYF